MRWKHLPGVAALACVLLGTGAQPAFAADEVGLSLDGRTWASHLTAQVIADPRVWVPGDVATGTLYIRNQSGQPATGRIRVVTGPGGDGFADSLSIRIRLDGGSWTSSAQAPEVALAAGQVVRLDIQTAFDPAAGNLTEADSVPLDVEVSLVGATSPSPGGELSLTGVDSLWLAGAAATLVLLGLTLVVRTRGSRDEP